MSTLLALYVGANLVLALLSLPLLAGKVKPNPFYGFRVAQTLENPDTWYAANRYFARYQLAAALIGLFTSIALFFWPGISVDAYALACLGVFVVVFGYGLIKGWQYLKDLQ